MALRLLVFDWDGTLADSRDRIVGCFQATLATLGLPARPESDLEAVIGLGMPETVQALYPDADPVFATELIATYRGHWLGPGRPMAQLFPRAAQTLDALRDAGYRLAVATGKSRRGLDRELHETELAGLFEATRCADETRSKPDPRMLVELLDETGVARDEAIMIGDTSFDLQMAASADVAAVGVSYGVHARPRLLEHRPRTILDAIDELPPWLAGLASRG